jgi:hypothetical protein
MLWQRPARWLAPLETPARDLLAGGRIGGPCRRFGLRRILPDVGRPKLKCEIVLTPL